MRQLNGAGVLGLRRRSCAGPPRGSSAPEHSGATTYEHPTNWRSRDSQLVQDRAECSSTMSKGGASKAALDGTRLILFCIDEYVASARLAPDATLNHRFLPQLLTVSR